MQYTQLRSSTFFGLNRPAKTYAIFALLIPDKTSVPTSHCRHTVLQLACTQQATGNPFKHPETSEAVMIKLISEQHSSYCSLRNKNKAAVSCDLHPFIVYHTDQNQLHPPHSLCNGSSISATAG